MYEPIDFELTKEERKQAADEGYRRHNVDMEIGAKGRDGAPEEGKESLLLDLIGAAGEMAVASFLDLKDSLYTEKLPVRGSYDIPPNIDVKAAMKHRHNLILKIEDNPEFIYVLVTFENSKCILQGWIKGEDGKIGTTYKENVTRRPSHVVPKGMLRSMSTLKEELKKYM